MPAAKTTKKRAILQVVLLGLGLILFNILASYFHFRWDLTSEHRYTLSPSTEDFLQTIDDDVYITVYLKGEFPSGFKKLAEATRMTLSDFRGVCGNNFRYQFVNPLAGVTNPAEKEKIYKQLSERGINPTKLEVKNDNNQSSSIIFPRAMVNYHGNEVPVNLLEERFGQTPQEQLNASENLLEYKFAKALSILASPEKDRILVITGQNESVGWESYEALKTLEKFYILDTMDITRTLKISPAYRAALIIKPKAPFTEKAKFMLDQYVMNGGKIIWFVEKLFTDMKALQTTEASMAIAQDLNLDDMLFKYGVRLNADYIQDMSCNPIPVITSMTSQGQPKTDLLPWNFYPVLMSDSKHPISHNMDAVMTKFASSLDTVENDIKKTILLHSSQYSRTTPSPVRVSLSMLKHRMNEKNFQNPKKPVAVLLEGKFESLYKERLPDKFLATFKDSLNQDFKERCAQENKMVVISDGDMILNDVSEKRGPLPWGYYQYTQQHFSNPEFVMNCLDYLTNKNNIIAARSKDIKLRVLDLKKSKSNKLKWQLINILLPILLILGFGSAYAFFRKRKYETIPEKETA